MTLDEARGFFEGQFADVSDKEGKHPSLSPTGEEYLVVCSGGLKLEGAQPPVLCASEELAIDLWLLAANQYAGTKNHKKSTLYWRVLPELKLIKFVEAFYPSQMYGDHQKDYWCVYSRFIISDKGAA